MTLPPMAIYGCRAQGDVLRGAVSRVRAPAGVMTQSSCRSYSRAKGPGTSADAFTMAFSLSAEDPRGPRRGAKGSCGTLPDPLS
jgi:hypothetical protein